MKHRIAAVVALLAVAGILAGCASSSEENGVSIRQSHWYDIF